MPRCGAIARGSSRPANQWNTDRTLARAQAALRQEHAARQRDHDRCRAGPTTARAETGPDLGSWPTFR